MALTPQQQAQEQISRAKHILVIGRMNPSTDTVASAVAFGLYVKAMQKQVDVVIEGFDAKMAPSFLTGADMIRPSVGALRALHITIDVAKTPIDELLYDVQNGKLDITVIPKEREWNVDDLRVTHGADRYDLIIAIDAPDMRSLGKISTDHADFLYRTHIINIDSDASNEQWGQVNLVNLNAVSVSEVVYELLQEWNAALITEPIATALLTGMVANTRGFRTPNVTPRTLNASSHLVAMGAKRGDIMEGLWRTRSISTLKLWGRALARLHHEPTCGLVWTILAHKDFIESGAGADCLPDVIDELIGTSPDAKMTALIYESETDRDTVCVTLASTGGHHAVEMLRELGATGSHDRATVELKGMTLIDAANRVIELLKKGL